MKLLKGFWVFVITLFQAIYLTVRSGFNTEKAIILADKELDVARARLRVTRKRKESLARASEISKKTIHTPQEIAEALVRVGRMPGVATNEFREPGSFGMRGAEAGKRLREHLREVECDT